jgi:Concanavalin A-like lectin/glucanases superfamily
MAPGDLAVGFGVTRIAGAPTVDLATVSDTNGVLNLDGDWTLEAWVKIMPAFDSEQDVLFYYGDPEHGYSLSLNYGGDGLTASPQVTTLGVAEVPSDPGLAVVAIDLWQHLAVVHKNGQSMTFFINGAEVETRPYTGGTRLVEGNKTLYIGARPDGSLPFSGLIDRIRISDSALTASELDSDASNPTGLPLRLQIARSQSSIVLSWPDNPAATDTLEVSNLLPGSNWAPEPTSPVVVAGQRTVTVPPTGSARYYRLKRVF